MRYRAPIAGWHIRKLRPCSKYGVQYTEEAISIRRDLLILLRFPCGASTCALVDDSAQLALYLVQVIDDELEGVHPISVDQKEIQQLSVSRKVGVWIFISGNLLLAMLHAGFIHTRHAKQWHHGILQDVPTASVIVARLRTVFPCYSQYA